MFELGNWETDGTVTMTIRFQLLCRYGGRFCPVTMNLRDSVRMVDFQRPSSSTMMAAFLGFYDYKSPKHLPMHTFTNPVIHW